MRTIKESSALQEKARKLVNNEIFMNISSLFEDALKGNQDMLDDFQEERDEYVHEYRSTQALEQVKEELSAKLTESQYSALDSLGCFDSYDELYQIDHLIDQGELNYKKIGFYPSERAEQIFEESYPDFYESWAVTSWLANKLREQGEFVFSFGWYHIWERQTTGQAVSMDYCILAITQDLID